MNNSDLNTCANPVQAQGLLICSTAYNGTQIRKIDLINYLFDLVDLEEQIEEYKRRDEIRSQQQDLLTADMERRYIRMPPDMKQPSGLASLSARKRREYQAWLEAEPERERERQRLIEAEDNRIAQIKAERDKLINEGFAEIAQLKVLCDRYKELLLKQIIPPDYRGGDIPKQLLGYLYNGRAHTLTDAINLYHEEQHRNNMHQIAQTQQKQAERAFAEQRNMAWQQLQMQYQQILLQQQQLEQLEDIAEDAKATRRATESTKFYVEMEYFTNR